MLAEAFAGDTRKNPVLAQWPTLPVLFLFTRKTYGGNVGRVFSVLTKPEGPHNTTAVLGAKEVYHRTRQVARHIFSYYFRAWFRNHDGKKPLSAAVSVTIAPRWPNE